jgi:hypothetical protein
MKENLAVTNFVTFSCLNYRVDTWSLKATLRLWGNCYGGKTGDQAKS